MFFVYLLNAKMVVLIINEWMFYDVKVYGMTFTSFSELMPFLNHNLSAFLALSTVQLNHMGKFTVFNVAVLLVCLALVGLTSGQAANANYNAWKNKFGKDFKGNEDKFRQFVFEQRVKEVKKHNDNPNNAWKKTQNKFSAQTDEELLARYLGGAPPEKQQIKNDRRKNKKNVPVPKPKNLNIEITEVISNPVARSGSKNWVNDGITGQVVDQGICGSCWTFTAAGVIESHLKITQNITVVLSKQQQLDCVYPGYSGCDGGWMTDSFDYAMTNGLTTESQYPYFGAWTGSCIKDQGAYKIKQYVEVKTRDCSSIVENLALSGPMAVGVLVVADWYSYSSGIYSCPDSVIPASSVNHGLIMVGYTEDKDFILQNSWGTTWGQGGFMTLSKTKNCNACEYGPYFLHS